MVNPYTYNNLEITEEPAEDTDPNAADSIAGFELQNPFGAIGRQGRIRIGPNTICRAAGGGPRLN